MLEAAGFFFLNDFIIIIIIEQIKNFEYLSCEIYYENEKNVEQKLFCSNTGNSEQLF